MKRYIVFYFQHFYPDGGMEDYVGDFDSLHKATKALHKADGLGKKEHGIGSQAGGHVYDTHIRQITYTLEE